MAIDAGDVSGLAALKTSCWLLQSGSANSVLCAAAQRALDRAALDNLQKCGRLRGFYPNGDHEGYSLGEGVALVVLKRHSDAKRDGDKILGIIDSIGMASTIDRWLSLCESLQSQLVNRTILLRSWSAA